MAALVRKQRLLKARRSSQLCVRMAQSASEVLESQALRYDVFARESGAKLHNTIDGIDHDYFDPHCRHVLVRDTDSGKVVASTRILTSEQLLFTGGFYSATEFDLTRVLSMPGRFMEIGRTCVHADYRNGTAITMLWRGISQFLESRGYDYLIGCASIGLQDGGTQAQAVMQRLRQRHMLPVERRVTPLLPYPPRPVDASLAPMVPPLLKTYLRLGAEIGGEPYWDQDFDVADVFVLLDVKRLDARYARHFQVQQAAGTR
jgi:putative hemolysin